MLNGCSSTGSFIRLLTKAVECVEKARHPNEQDVGEYTPYNIECPVFDTMQGYQESAEYLLG